jgi:AcrR family transcriptional regulator
VDGFKRRSELKKSSILQSALDLFMKYGIKRVSVAEIAKSANVSQVTIYNYFGSKDKLVDEVMTYYIDDMWNEYEIIMNSNVDFSEKIKEFIFNKKISASSIHEEVYTYLMQEFTSGNNTYIEEFYNKKALPEMVKLFEQAKKEGQIDPTISNEAILAYIQMYREFLQQKDVYEHILPLTEDLTKLFFYGIVGSRK